MKAGPISFAIDRFKAKLGPSDWITKPRVRVRHGGFDRLAATLSGFDLGNRLAVEGKLTAAATRALNLPVTAHRLRSLGIDVRTAREVAAGANLPAPDLGALPDNVVQNVARTLSRAIFDGRVPPTELPTLEPLMRALHGRLIPPALRELIPATMTSHPFSLITLDELTKQLESVGLTPVKREIWNDPPEKITLDVFPHGENEGMGIVTFAGIATESDDPAWSGGRTTTVFEVPDVAACTLETIRDIINQSSTRLTHVLAGEGDSGCRHLKLVATGVDLRQDSGPVGGFSLARTRGSLNEHLLNSPGLAVTVSDFLLQEWIFGGAAARSLAREGVPDPTS